MLTGYSKLHCRLVLELCVYFRSLWVRLVGCGAEQVMRAQVHMRHKHVGPSLGSALLDSWASIPKLHSNYHSSDFNWQFRFGRELPW